MHRTTVAMLLSALLAGCAAVVGPASPPGASAVPLPSQEYEALGRRGERVLRVDPARSLVVMEVRRAGALAELGHDHVVASRAVEGYIAPRLGRADLALRLDTLEVDDPKLREESGMKSQPSAADIEATRRNMLGPVLDAGRYPFAVLAVRDAALQEGASRLTVLLTLHGVTRSVEVPVNIETRDAAASATGRFAITQTSFGIVPFSLLGGAIAVQDRVEVRFRLVAADLG